MRSVPSAPLVGPFADRLLALDLPELDGARRAGVVAFTTRRVDGMPSVMRIGVLLIAALFRALLLLPGNATFVRFVATHPLPVVGEYVRLMRSLGYAYVWETWPDTRTSGAAA
jgi:hypothetical protein